MAEVGRQHNLLWQLGLASRLSRLGLCPPPRVANNTDQVVDLLPGCALFTQGVFVSLNARWAAVDCGYCQASISVQLLNATVLTDGLHTQVCALVIIMHR